MGEPTAAVSGQHDLARKKLKKGGRKVRGRRFETQAKRRRTTSRSGRSGGETEATGEEASADGGPRELAYERRRGARRGSGAARRRLQTKSQEVGRGGGWGRAAGGRAGAAGGDRKISTMIFTRTIAFLPKIIHLHTEGVSQPRAKWKNQRETMPPLGSRRRFPDGRDGRTVTSPPPHFRDTHDLSSHTHPGKNTSTSALVPPALATLSSFPNR